MVPKEDKPEVEQINPSKEERALPLFKRKLMLDYSEDEASISQQWVIIMDRGGLTIRHLTSSLRWKNHSGDV